MTPADRLIAIATAALAAWGVVAFTLIYIVAPFVRMAAELSH